MKLYLRLIILIPALFLYTCFNAQSGKWSLGVTGGAGLVSIRTTTINYPKTFRGWSAGFSAGYEASSRLSILANLLYERKQYKTELYITNSMGQVALRSLRTDTYQYISLPLMASWSFGKRTKFVINTGAYINYLMRETIQMDHILLFSSPLYGSATSNLTGEPKTDAGAILGVGLSHPLTNTSILSVELRNYAGLKDLSAEVVPGRSFMNYQTLLVGLRFKLGKTA